MPSPMAPRHLLLALGSFLAVSLGAQVPAPAPAPPPTVNVRTSVSPVSYTHLTLPTKA